MRHNGQGGLRGASGEAPASDGRGDGSDGLRAISNGFVGVLGVLGAVAAPVGGCSECVGWQDRRRDADRCATWLVRGQTAEMCSHFIGQRACDVLCVRWCATLPRAPVLTTRAVQGAVMLNQVAKVFGPIRELVAGFAITTYLVYSLPISGVSVRDSCNAPALTHSASCVRAFCA